MMAKTVLILCTGNSCRSQMAEALVNHEFGPAIRAISAGTNPGEKVAEGALEALRLASISTDGLSPKSVDTVMHEPIDLVVTVCDNAKETCPVLPRTIPSLHRPFHDPHGEPLESFIKVRDEIRAKLLPEIRERLA
jgi:arsenate reductase